MNFAVNEAQLLSWLAAFWLPFCRISGAILSAPLFSGKGVPGQFRIFIAVVLSALIAPMVLTQAGTPVNDFNPFSASGILMAANELLIGICLGFLVQLTFEAVMLAGSLIATGMGLGFATLIDQQQGTPVPVLGQFLMLITLLLFMALDGHLAFLELLMKSFISWPPGTLSITPDAAQQLLKGISSMFGAAMRIAMPAVLALLVVQIAMGVISRSSPSMNLFAVGFPLTMMVGFIVVWQVLPSIAPALEGLLSAALAQGGVLMEAANVR